MTKTNRKQSQWFLSSLLYLLLLLSSTHSDAQSRHDHDFTYTPLSQLHQLVRHGDIEGLKKLFSSVDLRSTINQQSNTGRSAIHLARTPEILQFLLNNGADPSITNHYGDSILLHMVQRERLDMVEILLARGASPDQLNQFGNSPIREAKWRGNNALYTLLIQYSNNSITPSSSLPGFPPARE